MLRHAVMLFVPTVLLCVTLASGQDEKDPWLAFRPLVGQWSGEGSGFGSVSDVTHEWKFALQGKFLRLQVKSVARTEGGGGEVHEDVGFLSHDTDRSSFVFRQFLSEGFVNTFDVSVEKGERLEIRFGARQSESAAGMRARMRLNLVSDTEYEMILELAMPGKDFAPCQVMRMKKLG